MQTGTVATMLANVMLYNQGARGEIERELELSVPTLIKVGLFDLFSLDEWVAGENPGRRFVGECARKYLGRVLKILTNTLLIKQLHISILHLRTDVVFLQLMAPSTPRIVSLNCRGTGCLCLSEQSPADWFFTQSLQTFAFRHHSISGAC